MTGNHALGSYSNATGQGSKRKPFVFAADEAAFCKWHVIITCMKLRLLDSGGGVGLEATRLYQVWLF
jgi:hypothetical protein